MATKSILHLNLLRQYFDQIALGRKKTEYRDRSDYWATRLEAREYEVIIFRNGFGPKVPEMEVEFRGVRKEGTGRSAQYAIRLGKILKIRRWKKPKE